IYNDVDQIYLTDPAELFDLEMGTHGYLAISAQDTSVMLIDCAKMMPYWNRQAAATGKKAGLTNGPAGVPGLWGALDGGWNARDVEYVEGARKVLHYTALHQQPWHPFPEVFSYHPNPLAYLWHELERDADASGYQVFCRAAPSAGFAAALTAESPTTVAPPSAKAVEMIAAAPQRILQLGRQPLPTELSRVIEGAEITEVGLDEDWPEGDFDAVIACGALDRVPVEDLPWLLDQAFSHARNVYLAVQGDAGAVGDDVHLARRTAVWWRSRLVDAASRHPDVSWHVDVADGAAAAPTAFQVRRVERDRPARVWALIDDRPAVRAQVMHLARALDGEIETKRLAYTPLCAVPNLLF
ncbi:MAG: hypothetical protein OET79_15710, partial [Nitrospirota bacterium]|nr:hypothetical protein [Nitrospirota bacterium]